MRRERPVSTEGAGRVLSVLGLGLTGAVWSPLAAASTLTVSADGTGDHTTIGAAIDAASDGDLIQVAAGTYLESVDFDGKDLSLQGASGSASTIIDAQGSAAYAVRLNDGEDGAAMDGFTIRNTGRSGIIVSGASVELWDVAFEDLGTLTLDSGALYADEGAVVELHDASFTGNVAGYGAAIYALDATIEVADSTFSDNGAATQGGAIWLGEGAALTATDTTFSSNTSPYGGAIYVGTLSSAVLDGAEMRANGSSGWASDGSIGGAVCVANYASLEVIDSELDDNAAYYGGAIYSGTGAEVSLTDSTVSANVATYGGGVMDQGGGTWRLDGSELTGNSATANGGGGYFSGTDGLRWSDSVLSDNTANTGGGAYIAAELAATTVEISGNTTSDGGYGAGLYLDTSSEASIQDSIVAHNDADYTDGTGAGGGIFAHYYVVLDTAETVFEGNSAYYGGAICSWYYAEISDRDGEFVDNYAYYGAGIGLWSGVELTLDGTSFAENVSYYYGAGLYLTSTPTIVLDGVSFTENNAYYGYGGGMYVVYASDLQVADTTFVENVAYYYGGAAYLYYFYGPTSIQGSTFTDNTATYGFGGALFANYQPDLEIRDSTFDGNAAYYSGGGLYADYNTSTTIDGASFANNSATYRAGGGASVSNGAFVVQDSSFTDNDAADSGGGVNTLASKVQIHGTEFVENVAEAGGGGAYISGGGGAVLTNNRFARNEASFGGGLGVYDFTSDNAAALFLSNTVFQENDAEHGGGTALMSLYDAAVVNNTLVGNGASVDGAGTYWYASAGDYRNNAVVGHAQSGAVHVADEDTAAAVTFAYNDWYDNVSGDLDGQLSSDDLPDTNLAVAPGFVAWTTGGDLDDDSFVLVRSSSLVDAGDPELTDPDGTRSDIGAFGGPELQVEDADGDGFDDSVDCDDDDATVNPDATDTWYDGVDSDCGGNDDDDADGDGFGVDTDCDDADATVGECEDDTGTGDSGADDTGVTAGDSGAEADTGDDLQLATEDDRFSVGAGCGCASAPAAPGGLWLVLLGLVVPLRRRSR